MTLSIVTTLYKSAPYIAEFYDRVTRAAAAMTDDYELVFVNDGSPDDAVEQAIALYRRDRHVRVLDLSRNFGHHKAMMTGIEHARGDLVFLLDIDLEEQPEWLGQFHRVMQQTGADAVYGVQARRKGGPFERLSGAIFYRGFNALLDHPIPENAVTARLMTRRYVNSLILHRDREMTMAPLWAMTGYAQTAVVVEKKSRRETSYSLGRRVAALVDNVTSFSNRPLVYIFYLGSFIMFVSAVAAAVLIWKTEHGEVGVPGWPTLIVSIWFLGGIMIFCLGVIGVYLSKVFSETKNRPYTIVRADYDHQGVGDRP
jgi:putative glycosyltransferase